MNKTQTAATITLGGTVYKVVKETGNIMQLIGPRGGETVLTRNLKHPSMWGHVKMNGYRGTTTWYVRSDDGSFEAAGW
jgi:hypothetical protein